MKKVKAVTVKDGTKVKRTLKSRVWFKVITKGAFGVVLTSENSEYSVLVKNSATLYV